MAKRPDDRQLSVGNRDSRSMLEGFSQQLRVSVVNRVYHRILFFNSVTCAT